MCDVKDACELARALRRGEWSGGMMDSWAESSGLGWLPKPASIQVPQVETSLREMRSQARH